MGLRSSLLVVVVAALVLSACGVSTPEGFAAPQPRDGKAGLRLTGTVGNRQIAVSDGTPRLLVGNCDPAQGPSQDVCFVSRGIDGTVLVVIIRNPAVLEEGTTLPVRPGDCVRPSDCEQVADAAVVDLRIGEGRLRRVRDGSLRVTALQTGARYAGSLRLVLSDGTLSGEFDVVPRPDR